MVEIKTAASVWANQPKADFNDAVASVMRQIEAASAKGLRKTCFNPSNNQYYDAVKRAFQEQGYHFSPTGYIGGVWQNTENICW